MELVLSNGYSPANLANSSTRVLRGLAKLANIRQTIYRVLARLADIRQTPFLRKM
jgi:hypothetical protein